MFDLGELTVEAMEKYVGQEFHVDVEGLDEPLGVTLTEALPCSGHTVNEGDRKPFSLSFRFPKNIVFEQQTVSLKHEAGELLCFLVPVAEEDDGRIYEAVFS